MYHYPLRSWNRAFHGSWSLFGHCHGTLWPQGSSIDVGVDSWEMKPVHFDQIYDAIVKIKKEGNPNPVEKRWNGVEFLDNNDGPISSREKP